MNTAVLAAAATPRLPGWGWVWAGYLLTGACAGGYAWWTRRARGGSR